MTKSLTKTLVFDWTVMWPEEGEAYIESPIFWGPVDNKKWLFQLHPQGYKNVTPNHFSLYLFHGMTPQEVKGITLRVGLVGSHGLLFSPNHFSEDDIYPENKMFWGKTNFMRREDLLNPENHLLFEGNLTIRAIISSGNKRVESLVEKPCPLSQSLGHLLKNGTHSDVKLLVEGQTINTHRAILASRSRVFEAMLGPDTKESKEGVIKIQGLSNSTVSSLISFLYTNRVESKNCSLDLLNAAEMYDVQDLKVICERVLGSALTGNNALHTLGEASKLKAMDLKEASIRFIKNHGKEVMESKEWKERVASDDPLALVLQNLLQQ